MAAVAAAVDPNYGKPEGPDPNTKQRVESDLATSRASVGARVTLFDSSDDQYDDKDSEDNKAVKEYEELEYILSFFSNSEQAVLRNIAKGSVSETDIRTLAMWMLQSFQSPEASADPEKYVKEKFSAFKEFLNKRRLALEEEMFNNSLQDPKEKNVRNCQNPQIMRQLWLYNIIIFIIMPGLAAFGMTEQATSAWPSISVAIQSKALELSWLFALLGTAASTVILASSPTKEAELAREWQELQEKVNKRVSEGESRDQALFAEWGEWQREITACDGLICCPSGPGSFRCHDGTLKRIIFSFIEAFGPFFRVLVEIIIASYCAVPSNNKFNEEGEPECTASSLDFLEKFMVPSAIAAILYFVRFSFSPSAVRNCVRPQDHSVIGKIPYYLTEMISHGFRLVKDIGIVDGLIKLVVRGFLNIPMKIGDSLKFSVPVGAAMWGGQLFLASNLNCSCGGGCKSCRDNCGLYPPEVYQTTYYAIMSFVYSGALAGALKTLYESGEHSTFYTVLFGYLLLFFFGAGMTASFIKGEANEAKLKMDRLDFTAERQAEAEVLKEQLVEPVIEEIVEEGFSNRIQQAQEGADSLQVSAEETVERRWRAITKSAQVLAITPGLLSREVKKRQEAAAAHAPAPVPAVAPAFAALQRATLARTNAVPVPASTTAAASMRRSAPASFPSRSFTTGDIGLDALPSRDPLLPAAAANASTFDSSSSSSNTNKAKINSETLEAVGASSLSGTYTPPPITPAAQAAVRAGMTGLSTGSSANGDAAKKLMHSENLHAIGDTSCSLQ